VSTERVAVGRGAFDHLVVSKLAMPPLPALVVPRGRVLELLSAGAPFTVVVAGPGYGKSIAVRQWLDGFDGTSAWVSLDPVDDVPARLWRYVAEAVHRATGVGDEALTMLASEVASSSVVSALLAELAEIRNPVAIVLDDLHVVRSKALLEQLAYFVERLPPSVQVIATCRTDPALPLGRWRAAGRLAELRQRDLAFRVDEAASMVRATTDVTMTDDDVVFLTERTEGWAAGLQLALLSVRGRPDRDPHEYIHSALADDHVIAEYLVGEVLERVSDEDRALLLDLSILDDFDIAIAVAVTEQADAALRVRSLEARGLLLLPVDERRERFRFHQLLRELLEHELRWRTPDRVPDLHRRAAAHLESVGAPAEAVPHLLAAREYERAHELVAARAYAYVDGGDHAAARRWLDAVPTDFVLGDFDRVITHVVLSVSAGRVDDGHELLVRLRRDAPLAELSTEQQIREAALRATTEMIRGDYELSELAALRCLALLGDRPIVGQDLDRLAGVLVRQALDRGNLTGARHWLASASAAAAAASSSSGSIVVAAVMPAALEAQLALADGRPADAERGALRAIDVAASHGLGAAIPVAEAHLTLGSVLLERGDLDGADQHAASALEIAAELRVTVLEAQVRVLAVALSAARLGPRAGLALLAATREGFAHRYTGVTISALLDAAEARLLIADGDLDRAAELVGRLPRRAERQLLEARLVLAAGRFEQATIHLRNRDGRTVQQDAEALVLWARSTPPDEGDEYVRQAAEMCVNHGLELTFLREGPDLLRVARRSRSRVACPELEVLLARAETNRSERRPVLLADPLTSREQELLALLPTHLIYREVASTMCVSINTVKTYQKALFRKLGASSRSEAVAIAQAGHLLEPSR
jgi:LuxR family maltose regulon positive regulatory protein